MAACAASSSRSSSSSARAGREGGGGGGGGERERAARHGRGRGRCGVRGGGWGRARARGDVRARCGSGGATIGRGARARAARRARGRERGTRRGRERRDDGHGRVPRKARWTCEAARAGVDKEASDRPQKRAPRHPNLAAGSRRSRRVPRARLAGRKPDFFQGSRTVAMCQLARQSVTPRVEYRRWVDWDASPRGRHNERRRAEGARRGR